MANTSNMMHIGGSLLNIGFGWYQYKQAVKEGTNQGLALAEAAATTWLGATVGFMPFMAITMGFGVAKAGVSALHGYYKQQQIWSRNIRTPFSQSFQHTDATHRAQMSGIQSIGIGRGLIGSEAGLMAQRYARR